MNKETVQSLKMDACESVARAMLHEFNNILATMTYSAELASYDIPKESPAYKDLERVIQTGNEAGTFISRIMAFCKPGRAGFTRMNLTAFLKESIVSVAETIPDRIELKTEFTETELFVTANPDQLRFVLLEMVRNGVRAIGEAKGEMRVTLKEKVDPENCRKGCAVLSVRDTGVGIPDEISDKVFDPFFTTRKSEAKGLGLSTVYSYLRNLGGNVWFQSEINGSTVFTAELPLAD